MQTQEWNERLYYEI